MKLSSHRSARGGYILAVTLVFVVVAVTVAVGLAVGRQMWGQMGEKQLHRVLTQTALDVDSLAMVSQLRQSLSAADLSFSSILVSEDLAAFAGASTRTSLSISPLSGDPADGSTTYATSTKVAVPASAGEDGFPLQSNLFFDQLEDGETMSSVLGMWDPYQGVWSNVTAFGVLTYNELAGGARSNKDVQPVRDSEGKWVSGSRLHAWTEVDTAKLHEVVTRRFPASAFTLYAASSGTAETISIGAWAVNGSASQPIGRYYLETAVVPARASVVVDRPLVASQGVDWDNALWLEQPSLKVEAGSSGHGGSLTAESKPDFYKNRYLKFGGMVATATDRPVALNRFAGASSRVTGIPSWFPGGGLPVGEQANILAQLWEAAGNAGTKKVWLTRADEDTMTASGDAVGAVIATQWVTVDDDAKQIILNINSEILAGLGRSLILCVAAGGTDSGGVALTQAQINEYFVRINMPTADGLGFSAAAQNPEGFGGLTIVTPHPVIIEGSFNAGGSTIPVMVAAQNIISQAPAGSAVAWQGVFLTKGALVASNGYPFSYLVQGVPGSTPSYISLTGSVLLWERGSKALVEGSPGVPWESVPVVLFPSSLYLSGYSYPPGTPALLDVRFGRERVQNYRIFSEDTDFTPTNE